MGIVRDAWEQSAQLDGGRQLPFPLVSFADRGRLGFADTEHGHKHEYAMQPGKSPSVWLPGIYQRWRADEITPPSAEQRHLTLRA